MAEVPADHYICPKCHRQVPYGERCLHNGKTEPYPDDDREPTYAEQMIIAGE